MALMNGQYRGMRASDAYALHHAQRQAAGEPDRAIRRRDGSVDAQTEDDEPGDGTAYTGGAALALLLVTAARLAVGGAVLVFCLRMIGGLVGG